MNKTRSQTRSRALFIDSAYRKKTKSVTFLIDLLSVEYDVEVFNIEEARNDEIRVKAKEPFGVVIFLQINPANYINVFKGHNIVFVPMYDTFTIKKRTQLLFLKRLKWLCFSRTYEPFLKGVDTLFVQYYPKAKTAQSEKIPNSFFFWQRQENIDWPLIKKLLGDTAVSRCNLHLSADPGVETVPPSADDIKKYNITFSSWYDSKEDFEEELQKYAYFFAPRSKEGIGLSFLDAMSMGAVIIAPDEATMNEYINHDVNGYLYDVDNPTSLDLTRENEVRLRSKESYEKGCANWESKKAEILAFIRKKPKRRFYCINKRHISSVKKIIDRAMGARVIG